MAALFRRLARLALALLAARGGARRCSAGEERAVGGAALLDGAGSEAAGRARAPPRTGLGAVRDRVLGALRPLRGIALEAEELHPLLSEGSEPSAAGAAASLDGEGAEAFGGSVDRRRGAVLRLVAQHFDEAELAASGPFGFEVYTCKVPGLERRLEVHAMPLRGAEDRARFAAEVKAHARDRASYLGWRRDADAAGESYGLLVLLAAPERLADAPLRRDKNMLLVMDRIWVAAQLVKSLRAMSLSGYVHGSLDPSAVWVETHWSGRIRCIPSALLAHRHPAVRKGAWADPNQPPLRDIDPPYVAPELRSKESLRFAQSTDVYAFGATMYYMLVGHPPDELHLFSRDFDKLSSKYPEVGELLLDCLDINPQRRISLKEAERSIVAILGPEHSSTTNHVARRVLAGLPNLHERPPWGGGVVGRIRDLVG